jgi:hypothetical protein
MLLVANVDARQMDTVRLLDLRVEYDDVIRRASEG